MAETVAFSMIDARLKETRRKAVDFAIVWLEEPLTDGYRVDYMLCDRHARDIASNRTSANAANEAKDAQRCQQRLVEG